MTNKRRSEIKATLVYLSDLSDKRDRLVVDYQEAYNPDSQVRWLSLSSTIGVHLAKLGRLMEVQTTLLSGKKTRAQHTILRSFRMVQDRIIAGEVNFDAWIDQQVMMHHAYVACLTAAGY
jgi:hypothetical protein